jgi:hypothetical protein
MPAISFTISARLERISSVLAMFSGSLSDFFWLYSRVRPPEPPRTTMTESI